VTRTTALIPAAGKSRRMGRPKLALPLGERTVLEHVVTAFRTAGIVDVLVVLGPHVAFLREAAETAGAHVLLLDDETPDMRATVLHGLAELRRRCRPDDGEFWFLAPADHPTLDANVLRILQEARRAHAEASILVPTFEGKRGHPALIAWSHVARIEAIPPGQGLNSYFREHLAATVEVPVATSEVLVDLDTPDDYESLREWFASR
jgi:molybdenum cofactor cytidylyltransferase